MGAVLAADGRAGHGTVAGPGSVWGPLLPEGRLRAGTVTAVGGDKGLLLALAAQAVGRRPGAGWAVVGLPSLGALAARDAGLDAGAGLWVDAPGGRWAQVVSLLVSTVPVILLGAPGSAPGRVVRRVAGQVRAHGAVLLVAGPWDGADLRLRVTEARWDGLGAGHGVLRHRRVVVEVSGRGAAGGAPRRAELLLPGPTGMAMPVAGPEPVSPPADQVRAGAAPGRGRALRVVG
ncbi:hypothetical protein ACIOC1_24320 [Streptomyces sp. NPDC088197]|uniref:hypothetical protein n=1 Tax=Streptomyces sp. NPDC088197 TaxID=3365840 RepID=UPI0037F9BF81